MRPELAWIVLAFLSGSIPFGLLIGRAKGIDVRKAGSGNIGATNVGRILGKRYFFLCFGLDLLKGLLPTLGAGWALGALGRVDVPAQEAWLWLAAMAAAVLGHVFCPWLKFKGGKGVATGLGALLGVFPVLTLAGAGVFALWLLMLWRWRYISLASIVGGATLPLWVVGVFAWLGPGETLANRAHSVFSHGFAFLILASLLGVLVVWTHRANIRRLRAGTEPKVGQRAAPAVSHPSAK
ncbi:MAG: glycerol-3-phosphate 1-O-acyltransferase PlsY [Phycisphaerales bacterium]|nr:glycerol-3-phosphate 1-O-acyltransferase PlsY [Phycisphaerales bacterium]